MIQYTNRGTTIPAINFHASSAIKYHASTQAKQFTSISVPIMAAVVIIIHSTI